MVPKAEVWNKSSTSKYEAVTNHRHLFTLKKRQFNDKQISCLTENKQKLFLTTGFNGTLKFYPNLNILTYSEIKQM